MSVFKQIHNKFWQNDFVLGLSAEERYFYIYLITNSMTTQCGIYKLNRKLAELETGYSSEKIERALKKFEEYGKVIISSTTTEIMLVKWFKHNYKSSKKTIELINNELKDVKDITLLKKLYDFCVKRQYEVRELFSGVIVAEADREKDKLQVEEASIAIPKEQEEVKLTAPEGEEEDTSEISNQSILLEELSESDSLVLCNILKGDNELVRKKDKGEELGLDDCEEDGEGEAVPGTTIAVWGFAEGSTATSAGEGCSFKDVSAKNTA